MKTIGIIGGMSWESSAEYYAVINRTVRDRIGAPHSAKILLHSLDFGEISMLQHDGQWDALGAILTHSAQELKAGGADCIIIATNTMHKLADEVQAACDLPLIHIVDPTAKAIVRNGLRRVGLLGTAFTMEQEFYRGRLLKQFGLEVVTPSQTDRQVVHDIIYNELVAGEVREESRLKYREIIARLIDDGAEGIILGCTEIMLLVCPDDSSVPLFDTTRLHAIAAADFALT